MKIRTAGILSVLLVQPLLCGAASSQTPNGGVDGGRVINGQIQFGDVLSTNLLSVDDAIDGLELTTDATGNDVVARNANGPMLFDSDQALRGYTAATSSAYVAGKVSKPYDVLTSATGNTATAGSRNGATTGESTQVIHAGGGVLASAYNGVDGPARSAVIDSNAVGNAQGWDALRGRIGTTTLQGNRSVTQAKAEAEFWRADALELRAVAAGNNVTADGAQSSVDMAATQEVGEDGTYALVDAHIYDVGEVSGYAEASGNSIDVAADGGNAGLISNQTNNAQVVADSRVSATFSGYAESVAYGVGNSVNLVNLGPRTEMGNTQVNTAQVTARSVFSGGAGIDVRNTATAIGNQVSGVACTECGGELAADSTQLNNGGVSAIANTTLNRGRARNILGGASAVGNSATFLVQSGN